MRHARETRRSARRGLKVEVGEPRWLRNHHHGRAIVTSLAGKPSACKLPILLSEMAGLGRAWRRAGARCAGTLWHGGRASSTSSSLRRGQGEARRLLAVLWQQQRASCCSVAAPSNAQADVARISACIPAKRGGPDRRHAVSRPGRCSPRPPLTTRRADYTSPPNNIVRAESQLSTSLSTSPKHPRNRLCPAAPAQAQVGLAASSGPGDGRRNVRPARRHLTPRPSSDACAQGPVQHTTGTNTAIAATAAPAAIWTDAPTRPPPPSWLSAWLPLFPPRLIGCLVSCCIAVCLESCGCLSWLVSSGLLKKSSVTSTPPPRCIRVLAQGARRASADGPAAPPAHSPAALFSAWGARILGHLTLHDTTASRAPTISLVMMLLREPVRSCLFT